jgi:hypothetical protein
MESDAGEATRTTGEKIMTEFQRLRALAVGQYWVADPQRLLYLCLTNAPAKDNHLVEFDRTIPPSYEEAAKLLFQILAQSDDEELKSSDGYELTQEILCGACRTYLQTVMAPDDFASFKKANTPRKFKSIVEEIFSMIEEA